MLSSRARRQAIFLRATEPRAIRPRSSRPVLAIVSRPRPVGAINELVKYGDIPESDIVLLMSNIVSGRQIRAARILAGLTQADLARAAGCHPRSVRYWENKGSNSPTNVASTLDSIEQALNRHGVIPFSTPTLGVRCSN